jgi:hypothetical protein
VLGEQSGGGVSNVDIDGNNALQIKGIGVVTSTFETLPRWENGLVSRGGARHENHPL